MRPLADLLFFFALRVLARFAFLRRLAGRFRGPFCFLWIRDNRDAQNIRHSRARRAGVLQRRSAKIHRERGDGGPIRECDDRLLFALPHLGSREATPCWIDFREIRNITLKIVRIGVRHFPAPEACDWSRIDCVDYINDWLRNYMRAINPWASPTILNDR